MILPDKNYKIPFNGEELLMNGAFDTLHYYPDLDIHWVRYQDPETNQLQMVILKEASARMLLDQTELPLVHREDIFESEHKLLTQTLAKWIIGSELDFDYIPPEGEEEVEHED